MIILILGERFINKHRACYLLPSASNVLYGSDAAPPLPAGYGDPLHTPSSNYEGWVQKWWKWLLPIDKNSNPANDPSGQFADANNADPDVYFLAGSIDRVATRTIGPSGAGGHFPNLSAAKAFLFPLVCVEWNGIEKEGYRGNLNGLSQIVTDEMDDLSYLKLTIDGGTSDETIVTAGNMLSFTTPIVLATGGVRAAPPTQVSYLVRIGSYFKADFAKPGAMSLFDTMYHPGVDCSTGGFWAFLKKGIFAAGSKHTINFKAQTNYYSTDITINLSL
jgi:hypothetical protein